MSDHFGISGFESPKCKPKSLADQIPETRKGGFRVCGSKLSFWNFGVWGFRSLEGERSGHSRGENPKSEVATKDFGVSGLWRPEGGEDIGFELDVSNSRYVKLR
jgi:hypothetical protein